MIQLGRRKILRALLGALIVLGTLAPGLLADGFIIPRGRPGESIPPLTVKYHHVTVEIANQVAKTSIDQVFLNNYGRDIEGTYIFPVPENAAISDFAMFIGNERVQGEIMDSRRARGIYEDIVRRMRDPGLLEYIGRDMFQARVYPIPANGEKRIQISYTEVLKSEDSLVRYRYPLNTERFSRDPLKDVSLTVRIESPVPILNVYSPSHKISVKREGERRAAVGYEEAGVRPDRDFVLYYSLSKDDVGLSFMNWQDGEAGYFLLLAAPRFADGEEAVIPKTVVLVLDSSGSMGGAKIRQAKEAARFILRRLRAEDTFSLIDFNDTVTVFSETPVAASGANIEKAMKFIEAIEDSGSTDINGALLKALSTIRDKERPNYILFLTDGLPTAGITDTAEILKNLRAADERRSRIIVFGVGDDVNTELLDRISTDHRGTSVYVAETENIESAVSSYYGKISSPVLSGLAASFEGIETRAVYPTALPDLFKGSQLVLVGKYTGRGPAAVTLSGQVGKRPKSFTLAGRTLKTDSSCSFLPRLWATRRVGYLLEEIRLHGADRELIDEVRKLGIKFGIVTPYTSFLVTEKERQVLDAAAPDAMEAVAARQVSGAGAVKAAKVTQALKAEDRASQVVSVQIQYKDDKTFYLKDDVWTDSDYKEGADVKTIRFNSDEYFRLIAEKPGLAKYLSIGHSLIVSYQGTNYKIVE